MGMAGGAGCAVCVGEAEGTKLADFHGLLGEGFQEALNVTWWFVWRRAGWTES